MFALTDKLKLDDNKLHVIGTSPDDSIKVLRPSSIEQIFTNKSLGRMNVCIMVNGAKNAYYVPFLSDFETNEKLFCSKGFTEYENPVEFVDSKEPYITNRCFNGIISWRKAADIEANIQTEFWIVRITSASSIDIQKIDNNLFKIALDIPGMYFKITANEELLAAILKAYESA